MTYSLAVICLSAQSIYAVLLGRLFKPAGGAAGVIMRNYRYGYFMKSSKCDDALWCS